VGVPRQITLIEGRIDPHPPRFTRRPPPQAGEAKQAPYSFEITSLSESEATIEARMIADTAERPNT
jgi:hypothetical protein